MEITYYTDGVVWVTNQRVVFVKTTYFLRDIIYFKVDNYRTDRPIMVWASLSLAGWLLVLIGTIVMLLTTLSSVIGACLFVVLLLLFFALIALSVYSFQGLFNRPHEDFYCIKFRYMRGTRLVYASFDRTYIEEITENIEFALEQMPDQHLHALPARS